MALNAYHRRDILERLGRAVAFDADNFLPFPVTENFDKPVVKGVFM
jgi:hypothetical protein